MTPRRFFALVAAAIVVLVLALSVARLRRGDSFTAGAPVMRQLAAQLGDITRVTLRHGAAAPQVTLQRHGDGWTLNQRAGYPADSARLRRLLVALAALRVAEEKTADLANYAALGVDDPGHPGALGTEVTITTATGTRSLIIGKPAAGGNFVRDAQQARSVLAVPGATPDDEPRDWIDTRLLDIRPAGIREVSVKPPTGPAKTHPGGTWAALADLDVADVGVADGIDWKAASVATVTLADGSALVLTGTVAGDRHWLAVSATSDTALAARSRGRAFELDAARYDAIFQP